MKECTISVIIPVYNAEKYIETCVNSVLAQTLQPMEIILVDDGSTDGSPAICDHLAQDSHKIRVIHKENGGAATARNAGLDAAQGEWIMFVDGDDLIHPQTLELLLDTSQREHADVAMCHYQFFQEEPPQMEEMRLGNCPVEIMHGPELLAHFTEHYRKVSLISMCMKLYRKEVFAGLRIPQGYIEEDSLVLPYILERARVMAKVHLPLYCWRETPGSVTRSGLNVKRFAYIKVSHSQAEFFRRKRDFKTAKFFRQEFLRRSLMFFYLIPQGNQELLAGYAPYRKLYQKVFLRYWLTAKLCLRERLAYVIFLFSPARAEKLYRQVYTDFQV